MIMEFYHNTPDDKLFVCDAYQARMIMTAVLHMYKKSSIRELFIKSKVIIL